MSHQSVKLELSLNRKSQAGELTRVGVCERRHKLQVLLHERGLVHHGGAGRGDERHGDGWRWPSSTDLNWTVEDKETELKIYLWPADVFYRYP